MPRRRPTLHGNRSSQRCISSEAPIDAYLRRFLHLSGSATFSQASNETFPDSAPQFFVISPPVETGPPPRGRLRQKYPVCDSPTYRFRYGTVRIENVGCAFRGLALGCRPLRAIGFRGQRCRDTRKKPFFSSSLAFRKSRSTFLVSRSFPIGPQPPCARPSSPPR